jgi:ATP-dependent Clp protease ATP-binding subunit ClpC
MEEGRLTDAFGRKVDFRNVVLIMTTNAGAEAIKNESGFGFQKPDQDASYESMKDRVQEQIEKVFRPEFLNRLDDVIIFRHLTHEDLKDVIELELAHVRRRLQERGYTLDLTDSAKEFLIKMACKDIDFGARPLRRAIENRVEDPLSEELLRGSFQGDNKITIDAIRDDEGKIRRLDFRGETIDEAPTDDGEAVAASVAEDGGQQEAPVKEETNG